MKKIIVVAVVVCALGSVADAGIWKWICNLFDPPWICQSSQGQHLNSSMGLIASGTGTGSNFNSVYLCQSGPSGVQVTQVSGMQSTTVRGGTTSQVANISTTQWQSR